MFSVGGYSQNPFSTQQQGNTQSQANARHEQIRAQKQQRYNEVYQHELAHKQAAGSLGGNIVIEQDADGWVTGGHVNITVPGLDNKNPEKTVEQAETVIRAALAPSDPSGQDYKVAAEAKAVLQAANEQIEQNKIAGSRLDISA